ncbi:MAG: signal peptidase I [Streptosporangiaceae bacterium]
MTSPAEPASSQGDVSGDPEAAPPRRRKRRRRALTETVIAIAVALLLALGLRAFVFQTYFIPTSSMVPALDVGDRILVQKAFFSWHDVHTGEIVVFSHPPRDDCGGPSEGDLVKRVIALPGQTIYSAGNNIYVDGRLLPEPFLPHYDPLGPPIPDASKARPFRVPAGEFYMMGDNRAISCDSRYWGPIKGSSMVGQVVLVWWHNGHPDLHGF